MLNGETLTYHSISLKEGYRYTGSYLHNNEWWVLEYNSLLKISVASKYELFTSSNSFEIFVLEVTYGNLTSVLTKNGEDDLASLMQ